MTYNSFGNIHNFNHEVIPVTSVQDLKKIFESTHLSNKSFLSYGQGRSYGDSCLNQNGTLLDVSFFSNVIEFNKEKGILTCEPGVTIGQVIDLVTPYGWFIPVTPGTKHVTIGGAVANDVHGKNHHIKGSFGNNVISLKLLISSGQEKTLTPPDPLFQATVGGLGLTGVITEITIQLVEANSWFDTENIKFSCLDEFFTLSRESERDWEYTVAWLDTCAKGKNLGKGIFMRGNHAKDPSLPLKNPKPIAKVPMYLPNFVLNQQTIKAFNWLFYNRQLETRQVSTVHYEPYLYPLDILSDWNKVYGRRGFYQYQFVIPEENEGALREILEVITASENSSFLSVLKHFGDIPPPGMLSFAKKGVMLALDFANLGEKTAKLFERLDHMVVSAKGRLYPAKDSMMKSCDFRTFYPRLEEFLPHKDPKMSSSFWRRVTKSI